jgi:hypothetical protein
MMKHAVVLTSCTAHKAVTHPRQLTCADFARGAAHVAVCEVELRDLFRPAEDLYSGLQHQRLMSGLDRARAASSATLPEPITTSLWIVSTCYGVVPGLRMLAPYACTFLGMGRAKARQWATSCSIPRDVRKVLGTACDLGIVLLSETYLDACQLDASVRLGGPTLFLCNQKAAGHLPRLRDLCPIVLVEEDTRRFSCGFAGLKGEVARRLLVGLTSGAVTWQDITGPSSDLLAVVAQVG